MGLANWRVRSYNCQIKPIIAIIISILLLRAVLSPSTSFAWFQQRISSYGATPITEPNLRATVRNDKFLEVPQIVWGLNNQKIALARGLLTARFLNRTLLMPSLSASLFYKEVELLQPMQFDKIFDLEKFNSICDGFVQVGQYSKLLNKTDPFEVQKGSGRKWTKERDLEQLKEVTSDNKLHDLELVRIVGKNPFLWHDHWPVRDYAEIFGCLALINEIENDVVKVISKIREISIKAKKNTANTVPNPIVPYIAVHMRIEKDWMIHCKKWEQRTGMNQICSSKKEILDRVSHITGINLPAVVYLAIADSLLEDDSVLKGWKTGLMPYEKKRLGVWEIYKKYPYLIQSAIDFEVCSRADIFVGNTFSTFSGLVVLSRTQRLLKLGFKDLCGNEDQLDIRLTSYAYNILGDKIGAPKLWMSDMADLSLQKISYGTNNVSCDANMSIS
ncbi:Protein-O-fucosyltransferase 1 [Rhynchospora pubera]|uniref:O-fucosyltransferase family protein n=1 Tax=Rhynchospora pubera TaxID=906938 RepID=A0AAV8HUI1_9POAL|nr:Protein-O-fucosyltransferase 1 [Rhynchospora pubera]KAJ4750966.1 Protein-O-fucosyltransferase 1 [Rhynchospora pubera]KAJ4819906.1 Protein-O-fucosyltransferase 1 [Rhynchospora pubera]